MTLNEQLVVLAVVAAIIVSIAVWAAVIRRLRRGEQIMPLEPRRPTPWAFVDLSMVVMAKFLFEILGQVLLRDVWGVDLPDDIRALGDHLIPLQLVYTSSTLATFAFAVVLLWLRAKANAADFGLRLDRLRYDLRVGFLGFVALAPPVYALQAALVHFFPTQHPLIDILRERPETAAVIVVSLSVAVVAPATEEFFLRVLLQGWLERIVATAVPGAFRSAGDEQSELRATDAVPAARDDEQAENPSATPRAAPAAAAQNIADVRLARAIPIVTSSLVFALLHVGQGPAPIPLFFLALGLGYLYQRTHRLWPSVVVHFLLNTASLAMLWLGTA
jgi:membrane protease YdiL (CAAX protease family)